VLARTALLVVLTSLCAWGDEPGKSEEEVDLDALVAEEAPKAAVAVAPTRVPEHDYDRRLLAFPMLLILILAWNVKWKPDLPPRRS
jgi:hypothetical protein